MTYLIDAKMTGHVNNYWHPSLTDNDHKNAFDPVQDQFCKLPQ